MPTAIMPPGSAWHDYKTREADYQKQQQAQQLREEKRATKARLAEEQQRIRAERHRTPEESAERQAKLQRWDAEHQAFLARMAADSQDRTRRVNHALARCTPNRSHVLVR